MTSTSTRRSRRSRSCSWSSLLLAGWLLPSAICGQDLDAGLVLTQSDELARLVSETTRESANSVGDSRRLNLALAILAQDSTHAGALREVGLHHAQGYRWYANFIAAKQPIGGGLRGTMAREFRLAYKHLSAAIDSNPSDPDLYRELLRLLIEENRLDLAEDLVRQATRHRPDDPDSWMLRGLVAQLDGSHAQANAFFRRAMSQMGQDAASRVVNPASFLDDSMVKERLSDPESHDRHYWAARDPLLLTEENERLNDHLARQAYSDIWYGRDDRPGWQTERGEKIMRYGFPIADFSFTAGMSRFNVLDFGDFDFVFEDLTRGGHFTTYSPKAGAGSSWAFDYVIKSGELARSLPERFEFRAMARTPVHASEFYFKQADGNTDVWFLYAIPARHLSRDGLVPDSARVGAFVVNPDATVLADATTRPTHRHVSFAAELPVALGTMNVSVPAGQLTRRMEYLNDDRSAYGARSDSISVPDLSASLALSDLVLAAAVDTEVGEIEEERGARIVRGDYTIEPLWPTRVRDDEDVLVYLEIYNLSDGSSSHDSRPYRINVTVEAIRSRGWLGGLWAGITGSGEQDPVSVSFEGVAEASDTKRLFAVDLSEQRVGSYRMTVIVLDQVSEEEVSRSVEFDYGDITSPPAD